MAVALLVAAGRGERLGAPGPKAFVMLAGRSLYEWSLEALYAARCVDHVVVAVPEDVVGIEHSVVGGASRSESVRNALHVAPAAHDVVLVLQERALHDEDELRVGGRAVALDAELARAGPLVLEREALDVPERGRAAHAPGDHRRDRVEADRRRADAVGVAAVALDDRAQDRVVGRQAGDADAAALQRAGAGDRRLREDGGQRALGDRHDADEVGPLLARDRQVVDVEHGEVGAARGQELDRVAGGRGLADGQRDALGVVVAARDGGVDAGVDAVGGEVEQEGRLDAGAGAVVVAAAGGEAESHRAGGEQSDGNPSTDC